VCAATGRVADIRSLNTVRKHLSAIKGGGLGARLRPATTVSLILSDVIADPLDVIASGPTVPDPTTFTDALNVLELRRR
jgi:hydroxypyruvate reductase